LYDEAEVNQLNTSHAVQVEGAKSVRLDEEEVEHL
jgi:hypothetical protein